MLNKTSKTRFYKVPGAWLAITIVRKKQNFELSSKISRKFHYFPKSQNTSKNCGKDGK